MPKRGNRFSDHIKHQTTRAAIGRPASHGTDHTAMGGTTTAIDRSDKPGHIGVILLVAGLLVGADRKSVV